MRRRRHCPHWSTAPPWHEVQWRRLQPAGSVPAAGRRQAGNLRCRQRPAQVRHGPAGAQQHGRVVVHVAHEERALRQRRHRRLELRAVHAARGVAAEQPLDHAGLVALGLQPADEPGAGVAEALVIEIDRVLRGQHDAEAECARLLHQREQRRLRRRHRRGREVPEDLVHVEERTQARGARAACASRRPVRWRAA